ncbi:uncharacterized protein NPIL_94541 [Nephila pilipes]|uniref:Uncharacterized protein n=1 Tax=Nephila pilipes TaxID=299642 RepID=A0A8X6R161_NEPPI|nr:uncharacterized protein NPIL_94541 [Nephila pilipes]
MAPEPRYGFMYLNHNGPSNTYTITCFTDTPYENMISCVQAASTFQMHSMDEVDHKLKVAYFKVLNNNDIVRELHNMPCIQQRQIA